ncbi:unnamed protein product [Ambrosiozyma monospora]|uniref:Unnamed protein product n=1 Tax=Ambrosiozyma monospora TaxID=43982 RepID=A0ACB5TMU2_AMBMO|nr:unnamed protein product [Ambrosiozyma monospora]
MYRKLIETPIEEVSSNDESEDEPDPEPEKEREKHVSSGHIQHTQTANSRHVPDQNEQSTSISNGDLIPSKPRKLKLHLRKPKSPKATRMNPTSPSITINANTNTNKPSSPEDIFDLSGDLIPTRPKHRLRLHKHKDKLSEKENIPQLSPSHNESQKEPTFEDLFEFHDEDIPNSHNSRSKKSSS